MQEQEQDQDKEKDKDQEKDMEVTGAGAGAGSGPGSGAGQGGDRRYPPVSSSISLCQLPVKGHGQAEPHGLPQQVHQGQLLQGGEEQEEGQEEQELGQEVQELGQEMQELGQGGGEAGGQEGGKARQVLEHWWFKTMKPFLFELKYTCSNICRYNKAIVGIYSL